MFSTAVDASNPFSLYDGWLLIPSTAQPRRTFLVLLDEYKEEGSLFQKTDGRERNLSWNGILIR